MTDPDCPNWQMREISMCSDAIYRIHSVLARMDVLPGQLAWIANDFDVAWHLLPWRFDLDESAVANLLLRVMHGNAIF